MPLIPNRPVWNSDAAMDAVLESVEGNAEDYASLPAVQAKLHRSCIS